MFKDVSYQQQRLFFLPYRMTKARIPMRGKYRFFI